MAIFSDAERIVLEGYQNLVYANPFLPERIDAERTALGEDYVPLQEVWSARPEAPGESPNIIRLMNKAEELLHRLGPRLRDAGSLSASERELYSDLVLYVLYYRFQERFFEIIERTEVEEKTCTVWFYSAFSRDLCGLMAALPGSVEPAAADVAHLFACFYQIRRAFHSIFRSIIGQSMASARLRAAVWQSIFTHDVRRYRRVLYNRMRDYCVLITGASGTGKELVARAIGQSSYLPFDPEKRQFAARPQDQFLPLNLSAFSPTLIESELFGHRQGAFTGAQQDHQGWFERCEPNGTVFLDEVGDIDMAIQVKLLRVLETRTFQRLGDTSVRHFRGKIAAATHRDLHALIEKGHFRQDLYYRLCSDVVRAPSLQEQIAEDTEVLQTLVAYLARRLVPEEDAQALTRDVIDWIETRLGIDYAWPGNVRELDQCVRSILIRKEYTPMTGDVGDAAFLEAFRAGRLSADQMLSHYCTRVYAMTQNYQETARRLEIDHRTVKARIDPDLLDDMIGRADKNDG